MILVEPGVAFSDASDGDMRNPGALRDEFCRKAFAPTAWATMTQVHGSRVVEAIGPGDQGEADAIFTESEGLAVGVFTADCLGVVVVADGSVGVAHAGWRGRDAGVVGALVQAMGERGHRVLSVHVGPGIGPCCFEVGRKVGERFDGFTASTSWGTESVDLAAAVIADVKKAVGRPITLTSVKACTRHEDLWFSHRRDGTSARMVSLGWLEKRTEI